MMAHKKKKSLKIALQIASILSVLCALVWLMRTPLFGIESGERIGSALLHAADAAGIPLRADEVQDGCFCDADGDGTQEAALLLKQINGKYANEVLIVSTDDNPRLLARESVAHLNPWQLCAGDVDGDKLDELSLGVYTQAKFHPEFAKRPFVYSLVNGQLQPKWLGSRLSRPFDEYGFADMNGDGTDELIAIEINCNNQAELNVYHWKGFGFESLGTSRSFPALKALATKGRIVSVLAKDGLLWKRIAFSYDAASQPALEVVQ